jgi:light-regulated signal transduction histidine kinase (bacteriophytochrome)
MMGRLGQVHGCHASGQLLPLEASISYTTVAGRKSYTAILRDVSEQQRVAADLVRAHAELEQRVAERTAELAGKNRELETFSYTVSHDLKAPLRGIDGYSLLLLTDHAARLGVEARTFLGNIRAAAAHMNQLIDDLLVYARLERRPPELVPLDIVAVVDSSLDECRHDHGGIALSVELSPARVLADRESLAMSVRNLVDNAIKFSRASTPPEVAIRGSVSADRYVLSVRDNGTGFDLKYHERIFQIFQRLHRSEDYPGTGVGLAIVRKAVERMHGRVWTESAVGSGATFYLELTCADPAPDTRVASSHA